MAIDIVARALAVSGKQSLENYYTKTESDAKYSQATNLENGAANVLIQTTDTNHSFKVMTDGRAKVQSAPTESNDVVRKLELEGKLTKPTNPSAESAVTMLSDGTVGTKPLTSITGKTEVYVGSTTPTNPDEILWIDPNGTSGGGGSGGGKLYKHIITVSGTKSNGAPYDAVWPIIDNHNKTYTFQDVIGKYYPFAGGMPILVYSDDPATPRFLALLTAMYQIVVGMTVESDFGTARNFKDTVTEL